MDSKAYQEFLQAASHVPEALPRPVALQPDLRVVLNLPKGSAVAMESSLLAVHQEGVSKRPRSATGALREPPKEADGRGVQGGAQAKEEEIDYDGCCGVLLSESEGFWKVEVTRKGVTRLGTMNLEA